MTFAVEGSAIPCVDRSAGLSRGTAEEPSFKQLCQKTKLVLEIHPET
jgi:hypothetical protein